MNTSNTMEKDDPLLIKTRFDLPQVDDELNGGSVIWVQDTFRPMSDKKTPSRWSWSMMVSCMLMGSAIIGSSLLFYEKQSNKINHDSTSHSKRIQRLALLRPFGSDMSSKLMGSFEPWGEYLPCDLSRQGQGEEDEGVMIDIFLSISQSYEQDAEAKEASQELQNAFLANQKDGYGWASCFNELYFIETDIAPSEDLYLPSESGTNRLWVNGPNQQFLLNMEQIKEDSEEYDAVLLLEHDTVPVKQFWLDTLLQEAESGDTFAILGSKYKGENWDSFRSSLPVALQHHFNGNAMYNLKHPLTKNILSQLQKESDTPYNAVPYDYRISQMLVEGILGIQPDLPDTIVDQWEQESGQTLTSYSKRFNLWWDEFGAGTPMRESQVIANYARSNVLPHDLRSEGASLIHGAAFYSAYDPAKHEITLVVSDWKDGLSFYLLHHIDSTDHPFKNVIVLVPEDLDPDTFAALSNIKVNIDFNIQRRKHNEVFDICNADVNTEWFMITNSFHVVPDHVDLIFSPSTNKPVVPFMDAEDPICASNLSCRNLYAKSKQFDPNNIMIVHDSSMLFHTNERDEFCLEWKSRFGESEMNADISNLDTTKGPIGPSATTYLAYLSAKGSADSIYDFKDQTFLGVQNNFQRIFTDTEEKSISLGNAPITDFVPEMRSSNQVNTEQGMSSSVSNRRLGQVPVPAPRKLPKAPTYKGGGGGGRGGKKGSEV